MKQFYRNLLKKSYLIVRRYKFLWFFGLFAALMGNGGEVQMLFRTSETIPNLPTNINAWGSFFAQFTPVDFFSKSWLLLSTKPGTAIPMFLLLIILIVFVVWLVMVGQAALVHSVVRIQTSKAVDFPTVFAAVRKFAGKVFIMNFLTRFILYGGLVILLLPFSFLVMVNNANPVGLYGIILLGFIVAVPLAMIVNFVLKYALVYIVTEKESVWPALLKAFQLFSKHWFVSIELAVLMFLINIATGLALFVVIFFFSVPFLALSVLLGSIGFVVLANLALMIAVVVFMILIALVGAWLATFQYSAWTMLFMEIKKGRAYPKLMRMAAARSGGRS